MIKLLTEEQYMGMNWKQLAGHYGMKEMDFIAAVFPTYVVIEGKMYEYYRDWHRRHYSKLAQALK